MNSHSSLSFPSLTQFQHLRKSCKLPPASIPDYLRAKSRWKVGGPIVLYEPPSLLPHHQRVEMPASLSITDDGEKPVETIFETVSPGPDLTIS